MGWEAGRPRWSATWPRSAREGGARLPFDPEDPPVEEAPLGPRPRAPDAGRGGGAGGGRRAHRTGPAPADPAGAAGAATRTLRRWSRTNVRPQRQAGYSIVTVTVPLGDLTGVQMRLLGELALAYGDGTVRTTVNQDLLFRWVRTADVPALHARLAAAGLGRGDAHTIANVTSCPGAEACRLAVTQSRGLGKVLSDHLARAAGPRGRGRATSTSRSAAARTAAASTTSRAWASRAASGGSAARPRRSTS